MHFPPNVVKIRVTGRESRRPAVHVWFKGKRWKSVIVRKTTLRWGAFLGGALAITMAGLAFRDADAGSAGVAGAPPPQPAKQAAKPNGWDFGFIENKGQWHEDARFYSGWKGMDVWVTRSGIKYDFYRLGDIEWRKNGKGMAKPRSRSGHVIELQFMGASMGSGAYGLGERQGEINFIQGNATHAGVKGYNEAWVNELYSGVNMRVYRDGGAPRFDLVVAPGARPESIKFKYAGAQSARIKNDDTMAVTTRYGEVAVTDLYAYQRVANEDRQVDCKFVKNADGTFGFQVDGYDPSKPLVIDPVVYSTLYGGFATIVAPGDDIAYDVAVDQLNQPHIAGSTTSVNYPITNGAYDNSVSGADAFITKFSSDASSLIYSTVIGGAGAEEAYAIALDLQGRAWITGITTSPDVPSAGAFPTTPDAIQTIYRGGGGDAFVARISTNGNALEYGTYMGSFTDNPFPPADIGNDIGVDSNGNAYIVGQVEGTNFPRTAGVLQPLYQGGNTDGFVARISATNVYDYGTHVGGNQSDVIAGVAVDALGNAFIVGTTSSPNFPTVAGSFDTTMQGGDAFVAKLVPSGTSLDYSTFIGGSAGESASAIAIDTSGNAYICGSTQSVDFPRTQGAFDTIFNPPGENYVTKIAIDGASLVYSTFMSGGGSQQAIAVDDLGVAYIAGIVNPFIVTTPTGDDTTYNGPNNPLRIGDAYLQALDEAGSNMLYGSYFGGEEDDAALGLYVDKSRNAYLVGVTNSWTAANKVAFPTTAGVFKPTMFNDNAPNLPFWDGFLLKVKVRPSPLLNPITITPGSVAGTEEAQLTISLNGPASPGGAVIRIRSLNENVARPVDGSGNLLDQIVIPEGQTTFPPIRVTTSDVVSQFVVTFTAELEGDTKTTNLTVAPWLTNMTLSPNTVVGGNRVTGRVNLFRPASAGMTVSVSSSNSALAYAVDAGGNQISSFVVPTGDTTATFDILTRGVDVPTTVTILTKVTSPNLQVTRSQILQILPASLRSLSFDPNRVNGGEQTTGTILLDGEAGPTPVRVDLRLGATGNPPVGVTFPNGQTTYAVFIVRDVNNVEKGKSTTFKATAGVATGNTFRNVIAERLNKTPVQSQTGTIFVDATGIQAVNLDSNSVLGGTVVTGHVTLTQPASPSGFRVKVNTNNGTYAPFGTKTQIEAYVPPGAIRSNNFLITTKMHRGPGNIVARISTEKPGYPERFQDLTIRPLDFTFTANPLSPVGGSQNFDCNITLNEPAPTNGVTVNLTSSNTNVCVVPSNVKINQGQSAVNFQGITRSVTVPTSVTLTASVDTLPTPLVKSVTRTVNPLSISLTLNPAVITGGLNSTGNVTIGAAAGTGGVRINLTSSNTAVAVVTSSIIIAEGQTQGSFNIPTFQVGADTDVTITARTPAGVTATAVLRVTALNIQVTVNPNSVVGGVQNTVGDVVISAPAQAGGTVVNLTSSAPAAASVPSSIRISAGQTLGKFVITTSMVATNTTVVITARLQSGRQATTTMQVRALSVLVSVNPTQVFGGTQNATGLVTIDGNAPSGGITVTLTRSSNAINMPSSVVIAQGTSNRTFAITSNPVAADVNVVITARLPSGKTGTAILKVFAPRILQLTLDTYTVIGGDSTRGSLTMNVPAPAGGINVPLVSGNSNVVQVPSSVNIAGGTTFNRFDVTTTAVQVDTSVTITASYAGASRTVTLDVLAPTLVSLVLNPNTVIGGNAVQATITIDRNAPAGGLVVNLAKDLTATGAPYVAVPASATIPAGQRSVTITMNTLPVSRVVATQITASFSQRSQSVSDVLTLRPQ